MLLYVSNFLRVAERWRHLLPALQAVNRRIMALSPLIRAKERVLGIRAQIANDYRQRLTNMPPAPDQDTHRVRSHMVEVLCLTTVIDNYLEITRRRIAVFKQDLESVSSLAKRMSDSIQELSQQVIVTLANYSY